MTVSLLVGVASSSSLWSWDCTQFAVLEYLAHCGTAAPFFVLPNALALENLFYGSSSFERISSVSQGKPLLFTLEVEYDQGPESMQSVQPIFQIYPEDAARYVQVQYDQPITLRRDATGIISNTIVVSDGFEHSQVFLSVYFVGNDSFGNYYESGWIDSIAVDVVHGEEQTPPSMRDVNVSTSSLPPLKQLKAGIAKGDVVCKSGFVMAIKSSNGDPICLSLETKEKLLARGWIAQ